MLAAVIEAQNIATDNAVASKAGAILSGDEILINSDKAAVIAAQSSESCLSVAPLPLSPLTDSCDYRR